MYLVPDSSALDVVLALLGQIETALSTPTFAPGFSLLE
jgi:hypothetical protein